MSDLSVIETLRQHLDPQTVQQMSSAIGADPAATAGAVSMALPALVGALSKNASTPQGAAALDQALDAHDGSIFGNLGGLLTGGGGIGGAILGHILGSRRGTVEDGVAKSSGLSPQQVAQLLTMLAPLVMGVLGKMKRQGVDQSQLPDVLARDKSHVDAIPGLGGMLDSNHDGSIADDIVRLGTSALGGIFGGKKA